MGTTAVTICGSSREGRRVPSQDDHSQDGLDAVREMDLVARWQDARDGAALETLVESCRPRVESLARRYRHYSVPREDLVAEGHVGVLVALQRFDRSRGVRFMTYASFWVRACMMRHITSCWASGKTGLGITRTKTFFRLRRERDRCALLDLDETETVHHLCETFGIGERAVRTLLEALEVHDVSLDVEGDRNAIGGRQNQTFGSPDGHLQEKESARILRGALEMAFEVLDEREALIIDARYMSGEGATLAELGRALGVSRERARQIEVKALAKLARRLRTHGFGPEDLREAVS